MLTNKQICDIIDTLYEYARGEFEESLDGGGTAMDMAYRNGKMMGIASVSDHFKKGVKTDAAS